MSEQSTNINVLPRYTLSSVIGSFQKKYAEYFDTFWIIMTDMALYDVMKVNDVRICCLFYVYLLFKKSCRYYTGWPRINGTVDTVDFQGFALINN